MAGDNEMPKGVLDEVEALLRRVVSEHDGVCDHCMTMTKVVRCGSFEVCADGACLSYEA